MINLEKIISDCKKNKRKAQIELYTRYSPMLLGICSRYISDRAEAEDILQEGFLKILYSIKEYSGKGHFENWMKRIMVNTAITYYHKQKKHYYHSDINEVPEQDFVLDSTPEREYDEKELFDLLKTMPEGYKVIFNLYAIEGFKHKEIAEKLQIEESTSKSQYLRAKAWIIKEMKKLNWI